MNRIYAILTALVVAIAAEAQTLNVQVGSVIYQFPAAQTGDMTYTDGTQLTVMGKTFTLSDITAMTVDQSSVADGTVGVAFNGTSAAVTVAGNVAQYLTIEQSGAHVSITQSDDLAEEVTYTLSGTSTDGEFYMAGSYKATIELNGLTLTNTTPVYSGAAIHIQNGKRIKVKPLTGTTSTLVDAASGSQKGCLYIKGHAEFAQKGTLNVVGNVKHGIKTGEYFSIKNATINVTSAVGDGISCNEFFLMESGTINISGTGDDGIQCDLDGTESTGETTDHEDEDTGNIYLEGGTVNISTSAAAAKGIKASGDVRISGGNITVGSTGSALWDADDAEVKGSTCISADGNMTLTGGTIVLTNSGSGGKGIKADGTLTISDGTSLSVTTTGQIAYCQSTSNTTIRTTTTSSTTERLDDALHTSPKGIKSDGAMTISGGTVTVSASYHEAIESKSTLDITGGYVYAYSGDDAINSKSHLTISGGYVMANSTGNDGIDANGNLTIKGGNVFAIATSQPEVGLDANTESGYKLYITGGNVVAIGGFESGASISGGTAMTASYTKGAWYGLSNGSSQAFAFKVPQNSKMGTTMAIYTTDTAALSQGVTGSGDSFWSGNGYTQFSGGSTVSLSNYNSGGQGGGQPGGGPGGGQPGGGPGGH